ncbi:MAG TPA: cyclic nucleotide-binding domain-containing protein, partial [Polyangiaceae bacterium]|nr:cyclic nucleotide-binding domain-containing protein [Polyangiaceae bacterium]
MADRKHPSVGPPPDSSSEAGAADDTSSELKKADAEHTVIDGEQVPFTLGPGYLSLEGHPSTVRAQGRSGQPRTMLSSGPGPQRVSAPLPAVPSAERIQSVAKIASGGMGVVESAFDRVLLRRVARKTMHAAANQDPEVIARFVEEAQITAQLDHPNIVPVHDLVADVSDGEVFFTMKLVDGETLTSVFRALHDRPFSGLELERVLRVFLKVCDAVSFAHSRGVVHRDLKPDNIMVGSHGQVYVMDWGVALLLGGEPSGDSAPPISVARPSSAEEIGTLVGTVQYMSPEQALGQTSAQGPLTDVYGLGAILYVLLTGLGPSWAASPAEALRLARSGPVPAPETRPAWPALPPGLCRIAMKALSLEPQQRYASVEALRQDVESFLRGGGWFQVRTFAAGSLIVEEGAEADAAFLVTAGNCEVYRDVDGEKRSVRTLGAGEIFGEMGLLTRAPRTATVAARSEVTVMVITPEAL